MDFKKEQEPFVPPFQDTVLVDLPYLVTTSKGTYGSLEDLRHLVKTGKTKEAKFFIRDNDWPVSHVVRSHLWVELCRFQNQEKTTAENYYWDTVKQMFDPESTPHLPAFVDSQCTMTYHLSTEGRAKTDRVISIVGYSYPAITFSPTVYAITSLLLHYMSEEDSYNALSALLSWKHSKFVIQTKTMYETSWRTVLQLTKKFAKAAYGNISKYLRDVETMDQVFEQWLWWIFKYLPFTHLVRVMDCFLYEGNKVLYRTAMALLILFQKHSAKNDSKWAREASANGISSTIAKFAQEIPVPADKLLKIAFGIRALSQSEINRIVLKTEMIVKSRQNKNAVGTGMGRKTRSIENLPTSQVQDTIQTNSHTLKIHELLVLWSWIPARITMYQPKLIYTTEEHGCSLTTFYARVEDWEPTVIIVKTTTNEIFGAYCSMSWRQRNMKDDLGHRYAYFGTGESFVFTIAPKSEKFAWIGIQQQQAGDSSNIHHAAELFMAGDSRMLTIGGGNGQAILLDENVRFGRTETCQTFNNPPLCAKHDFECKVVEVFGFV